MREQAVVRGKAGTVYFGTRAELAEELERFKISMRGTEITPEDQVRVCRIESRFQSACTAARDTKVQYAVFVPDTGTSDIHYRTYAALSDTYEAQGNSAVFQGLDDIVNPDYGKENTTDMNLSRLRLNEDQKRALQDADPADLINTLGEHLGTAVIKLRGTLPYAYEVEVGLRYRFESGHTYTIIADLSEEYVLLERADGTEVPELKATVDSQIRSGEATVLTDEG